MCRGGYSVGLFRPLASQQRRVGLNASKIMSLGLFVQSVEGRNIHSLSLRTVT